MNKGGNRIVQTNKYVRQDPTRLLSQRGKYITNGPDNSQFYYVEEQYLNSPTNAAIIDSVVSWVMGDGLIDKNGNDWVEIISDDDLEGFIFDYKLQGSACLQVVYNLNGKISKLYHVPTRCIAIVKQDDLTDDVDAYWFSYDWRNKSYYKPYQIPAYGKGDGFEAELYRVCRKGVTPLFPEPDYSSALQWCETEAEVSNFSINHLKNNFTAGRVVNIYAGNLQATTEEDLQIEKSIIEREYVGTSPAGKTIIGYYNSVDEKTTIDDIPIIDAHKQFVTLSEEAENKIIRGHKIPSGSLFDLPNPVGFSSAADEQKMALKMMYKKNINPIRKKILTALEELLGTLYDNLELEFEDFDLDDGVIDNEEIDIGENNNFMSDTELSKWRPNINSSNVNRMLYNDETFELVVEFHGNSIYTFYDVDFELFKDVYQGVGICRTSGSNEYGSWWIGKTPSVGAAVNQLLSGKRYSRGGTLK